MVSDLFVERQQLQLMQHAPKPRCHARLAFWPQRPDLMACNSASHPCVRCLQVRRTYKKLALQLHPDKAASAVRPAPRCAGCGSAPFEAQAAQGRLQERATWLFKLLGAPWC